MLLAMDSGADHRQVKGLATREPAFNTPAVWIEPTVRDQAETARLHRGRAGQRAGHASDRNRSPACRRNPHSRRHQASGRRTEKDFAGCRRGTDPQPDEAHRRAADSADAAARAGADPSTGLRSWKRSANTRGRTKDPILLTEYVRHRLARVDLHSLSRRQDGRLYVITLDPALEDRIRAGLEHNERGLFVRLSPQAIETTCRLIGAELEKLTAANHPPIVLVSPQIRAGLKQSPLRTCHGWWC